jgi:hypothetical protein
MTRFGALLWLAVVMPLMAEAGDLEAGGYLRYLLTRNETHGGMVAVDHLVHARANTKWYATPGLTGVLELRARAFYGKSIEETPGYADRLRRDAGFGSLGAVLWNGTRTVGFAEIDRAHVDWNAGSWQLTAGRQRIAWGTALVWNPIDLFNPQSVLDFDYSERPAADAFRLQYYTGEVSKVEVAAKPGRRAADALAAVQWTANAWDYDFHALAGRRGREWFGGGGWSGDIAGGGFRGEFLAAQIPDDLRRPAAPAIMVSGALSGDYTFPNSLYLHTEVLYGSEGVTGTAAEARARAELLGLLSPARWSLYQEAAIDVSALVRATTFVVFNPSDQSFVLVPSATWSVVTNVDLALFVLLFSGAEGTEFGGAGTSITLRCAWAF